MNEDRTRDLLADFENVSTPVAPQPVKATPVAPQPIEVTPVAPQPVEATPVAPQPVEATPVAPQSVEATPVAAQPIEATPINPDLNVQSINLGQTQVEQPIVEDVQTEEPLSQDKKADKKNLIFIGIILAVILVFILFLPRIINLFQ